MDRTLDNRAQMTLFTLLAVARPATNRELKKIAGLEVTAPIKAQLTPPGYLNTTRRGGTFVHEITKAGRDWCLTAFSAGRPAHAKFPSGVMHLVLAGLGTYLARTERDLVEVFQPDLEMWIRAVYAELTVRRPGKEVRLAKVRAWFGEVSIDDELRAMNRLPDVHLRAALDQRRLSDVDRRAAVDIGGEPRDELRIGPA